MLGHVTQGYLEGNTYPEANQVLFWIRNAIYAFHMPLYMMISGCVYATAYFDGGGTPDHRRIRRQVANLLAVYVLFSVVFGLMKIVFSEFTVHETTLRDVLLLWAKPIKVYWYLYDLAILYLLFSAPWLCRADARVTLGVLAVTTAVGSLTSIRWFEISRVMYYALFFYMGIVFRRQPDRLLGNKAVTFSACGVSAVLCVVFWDRRPFRELDAMTNLNSIPIANAVIAFGLSALWWYLFRNGRRLSENRFLNTIGRYSMEIYVIHGMVSPAVRTLVSHMGALGPCVSVLINCALCVAIPMMISLLCKRLRIHGLFFKPVTYFSTRKRT